MRSAPRRASSGVPAPRGPSCSIGSSLLTSPAPANDVFVGSLALLARPVAERWHAPRRHRVTPSCGRALAAAVRVVDRIHGGATSLRPDAQVTLAPRLADLDVLVLCVADRADGRAALGAHHPHLAGG